MIKAVIFDYDWVLSRWVFWRQVKLFKLAHELRKKNIKVAILSNRYFPLTWLAKLHKGILDFDAVVWARQMGTPKPDKRAYLEIVKKLDVLPQECLFIDNREKNVTAAENLGMTVLWAKSTDQVVEDIKSILKVD